MTAQRTTPPTDRVADAQATRPADATPLSPENARPSKPRTSLPPEIGGTKGPEPTRYGDWEHKGRCTDF